MSDTAIEWTDKTWNPVRGCSKVSPGCANCYAERSAARQAHGAYEGLVAIGKGSPRWTGKVRLVEEKLDEPLRWKKPARIFVNSMSDLFHEALSFEDIAKVFFIMVGECSTTPSPDHTYQVLTKRAERMREFFKWLAADGMVPASRPTWVQSLADMLVATGSLGPRVWLGVSVENQATANVRIPALLETPAAVRFLSCEPLLEHVIFARGWLGTSRINWVIVGGESGPGARRTYVDDVRSVVKQCRGASVPVFVKQMGAYIVDRNDVGFDAESWVYDDGTPVAERAWPCPVDVEDNINGYREEYQGADVRVRLKSRKGGDPLEWPFDLRVREFPEVRQ